MIAKESVSSLELEHDQVNKTSLVNSHVCVHMNTHTQNPELFCYIGAMY